MTEGLRAADGQIIRRLKEELKVARDMAETGKGRVKKMEMKMKVFLAKNLGKAIIGLIYFFIYLTIQF